MEQVVQALPIVWFPRNREKMKKKKDWPQLTQIAGHDGNCCLLLFFLAISNLDFFFFWIKSGYLLDLLSLLFSFWELFLGYIPFSLAFCISKRERTLGFNKSQTQQFQLKNKPTEQCFF